MQNKHLSFYITNQAFDSLKIIYFDLKLWQFARKLLMILKSEKQTLAVLGSLRTFVVIFTLFNVIILKQLLFVIQKFDIFKNIFILKKKHYNRIVFLIFFQSFGLYLITWLEVMTTFFHFIFMQLLQDNHLIILMILTAGLGALMTIQEFIFTHSISLKLKIVHFLLKIVQSNIQQYQNGVQMLHAHNLLLLLNLFQMNHFIYQLQLIKLNLKITIQLIQKPTCREKLQIMKLFLYQFKIQQKDNLQYNYNQILYGVILEYLQHHIQHHHLIKSTYPVNGHIDKIQCIFMNSNSTECPSCDDEQNTNGFARIECKKENRINNQHNYLGTIHMILVMIAMLT